MKKVKNIALRSAALLLLLLILMAPLVYGLTSGYSVDKRPTGAWWSGSRKDTALRWAREIEDILEEDAILFTPTNTVPTATRGRMYYDADANGYKYFDGVSWINFDAAGAGSLDVAYDAGSSITVDSTTLTLTAPNANDKVPLTLVQEDTSTTKAFVITNAGTGNSIDIQGQSSAMDIQGTGDLWNVSTIGVGTYAGLVLGGTDLVMENDDTFANSTDDYFVFSSDNKENFIIDLSQTDIVALTSSSNAVTLDTGTFATITGISTITGSNATDFTIQHTADTADEDLIISQAGSGAYSVIIQSAGTGTDSISIQATKGIDIDSVDDMAITNTASTSSDDFRISQVGAFDSSLILSSAGTGNDAIQLVSTSATGSIKINSNGGISIYGTGDDVDIYNTATANTDDLTVRLTGTYDASLLLSSTGTGVDALGLATSNATGVIKISSSDILDIDAVDNVNIDISGVGANLDIDSAAGSIYLDAGEAATNAIDIDTQGGIDIDMGAGASYDFDVNTLASISFTTKEASVTDAFVISTQGGIDIDIGAGAGYDFDVNTLSSIVLNTIEAATDAVNIDTQGGIDIDMGAGSTYDFDVNTLSSFTLKSAEAATDAFNIDLRGGFDVDMGGGATYDFDVNTLASISFVAKEASTAGITLNAPGDESDIDIDASDTITVDANVIVITASDSTTAGISNLTLETDGHASDVLKIFADQGTGATSVYLLSDVGGITMTASAGPILLNATGGTAGDYTATIGSEYILDVTGGLVMTSSEAADDAIELVADGTAGGIKLTSLGDILLTTTGAAAEDIMLTNTDGSIILTATEAAVSDGIVLNASGDDGGIDIDAGATVAIDANVITITASDSDAAGISNLTVETDGHASDVLKIFADQGTGATAIWMLTDVGGITATASAGPILLNALGSNAGDLTITVEDDYVLPVEGLFNADVNGTYDVNTMDDITINLTAGTSSEDIVISLTGASAAASSILVSSVGTAADSISLQVTGMNGGMDIDTGHLLAMDANVFSLDSVEGGNITVTAAADANDLTIAQAGIHDSSLILSSVGTAADSIKITTDGGGIDIDMGTASAGEDFDVNSLTSIHLTAKEAQSDAIVLSALGANAGIDIDAAHLIAMDANTFSIDGVELGNITVTSAADGNDLTIALAGTGNSSLLLSSIGTAADAMSFQVTGDDGAIDMDAGGTITIDANVIAITASDTDAAGVSNLTVETNGHTSDVLKVYANQGNADDSVFLLSDAGGITLTSTIGSIDIEAMVGGGEAGDIILNAGDDMTLTVADDFTLAVTGTTILPETVILSTTTAISDTEMDNLAASPITVVASPSGTDGTVEFISAVFALDWGGLAWTENTAPDDLVIRYTNGSGAIVSQLLDATGFATATEDTIAFLTPTVANAAGAAVASVAVTEAASTDQALVLHNTGDEWTNSGDSQVVVIVYYRIHRTTLLGL